MGCLPSKSVSENGGPNVFGVDLAEVAKHKDHPMVPKIVVECITFLERPENIKTEGIYKTSGSQSRIKELKEKVIACK